MGITHFDIITAYVIKSNLQTGDNGLFTFTLLHLQQIIFTGVSNRAQIVQFGIYSLSNNTSLIQQGRRIVINLLLYPFTNLQTSIQLLTDTAKAGFVATHASILYRLDGTESHL